MKRFALVCTTTASLLAFSGTEVQAQGSPQPAPWTAYGSTLYATGTDIWVRFFGSDAGYASTLFFVCPMMGSCNQYLFENHVDAAVNQEVKIDHSFAIGEEVVFKLFVATTGDSWYTGGAGANADGYAHFATQGFNDVTANATYSVLGGFEDLPGGGDRDHNDLMFEFSNVSTAPVTATPEPASLVLMGTGFAGVGIFVRRRRRSAVAA